MGVTKESARDQVVNVVDIRRVIEVMIGEEIVVDALNLKEKHVKACKEDLERLEESLESEEMEMMMNRYRTLIESKVEDQKELEEVKRCQEEEKEAECENIEAEEIKERIEKFEKEEKKTLDSEDEALEKK